MQQTRATIEQFIQTPLYFDATNMDNPAVFNIFVAY